MLVDADFILRYLLDDHPQNGRAAKKLIEEAGAGKILLEIPFITVSDAIFRLQRIHRIPKANIGRELLKVLSAPGIKLTGPPWLLGAVEEYRTRNISFGDACIAAEARQENLPVASFDKGLDAFPGIKRFEPR
jgi:predicted nucleic acid-binding protein